MGLLTFVHHDIQQFGETIVRHLKMDPARHYPQIFLKALGHVTDKNIYLLAGGAALYSTVRFVEAYGLWRDRVWAEWLAILSCGIYIPVEFYELYRHVSTIKILLTGSNALLVIYLIYVRYSKHKRTSQAGLSKDS